MKFAIPSEKPGGLEAQRSEHFGHCDVFTVIKLQDGTVEDITVIDNAPHGKGGCVAPVNLLKDAGVEAIVVMGMGARPMQGFSEAGIDVYYAHKNGVSDVRTAVEKMSEGGLPIMHPSQSCKGSGNCQH